MTKSDLLAVLNTVPTLTSYGMGIPKVCYPKELDVLQNQHATDFALRQQRLIEAWPCCDHVATWLQAHIAPVKTFGYGSYGLKHLAEKSIGEYVANGVIIAAAIYLGYGYRCIPRSPNVRFAMSKRDVRKAWLAINQRSAAS